MAQIRRPISSCMFLAARLDMLAKKKLRTGSDAPLSARASTAQSKMTDLAKDLAEKGEIMIAKNSAEEELVY
jgi:flagellar motor switch protein FliG